MNINNNFRSLYQAKLSQQDYEKYQKNKKNNEYTNETAFKSADVNNDNKVDSKDKKLIDNNVKNYEKSVDTFDFNGDSKFDINDILSFQQEVDIDGDGVVSEQEKAFLQEEQQKDIDKTVKALQKELAAAKKQRATSNANLEKTRKAFYEAQDIYWDLSDQYDKLLEQLKSASGSERTKLNKKLDTISKKLDKAEKAYNKAREERSKATEALFNKSNIRAIEVKIRDITVSEPYINDIKNILDIVKFPYIGNDSTKGEYVASVYPEGVADVTYKDGKIVSFKLDAISSERAKLLLDGEFIPACDSLEYSIEYDSNGEISKITEVRTDRGNLSAVPRPELEYTDITTTEYDAQGSVIGKFSQHIGASWFSLEE